MDRKGAEKRKSHKKGRAEKERDKKKRIQEQEASHYQKVSDIFRSKEDVVSLEGGSTSKSVNTETAEQTAGERTEISSDASVKEAACESVEGCIELESDEDLEEKFQEDPQLKKDCLLI